MVGGLVTARTLMTGKLPSSHTLHWLVQHSELIIPEMSWYLNVLSIVPSVLLSVHELSGCWCCRYREVFTMHSYTYRSIELSSSV